jgi:PAS domain-containing protein
MLGRHRSAAAGIVALLVLAAFDIGGGVHVVPAVLFVLAPLAVALRGSPRDTALTAALAVPLAIAVGVTSETGGTGRWVLAIAGVAAGSALAVWLAALRVRADDRARRLRALTSALGALGEAVTITGADGRMVYANQAAVELLRAGSQRELLGTPPKDVMARFDVFDEAGEPMGLEGLRPASARRRRCSCATSCAPPARSAGCSTRRRSCPGPGRGAWPT